MPKLIRGREWKWWIVRNDHQCGFCQEACDRDRNATHTILGIVAKLRLEDKGYRNVYQDHPRYQAMLYQVFIEHMKACHPDILAEPTPPCMQPWPPKVPRDKWGHPRLTK